MTRQDATSILITFVIGFIAGSYFYLTGFSFKSSDAVSKDVYSNFVIEGESYGNCRSTDGCLSFQLLSDGSYTVLTNNESKKVKQGDIPSSLSKELQTTLTSTELTRQSRPQTLASCSSDDEGIDYTFNIIIEGKDHILDTCKTAVVYNSQAWLALAKLWNYFQTLK